MRLVKTLLLASPFLLTSAGSLRAQEVAGIRPGDRVRVTVREGMEYNHNRIRYLSGDGGLKPRVIIGTVSQRSEALLAITGPEGRDFWEVPSSSLEKLELNVGRERTFERAIPLSMAALGGLGGVLAAVIWEECTGWCILHPDSRADSFAWGLVAGAVVGIPVGILGGLKQREVWQDVGEGWLTGTPTPFLFVPKAGGFGLGAVIPIGR